MRVAPSIILSPNPRERTAPIVAEEVAANQPLSGIGVPPIPPKEPVPACGLAQSAIGLHPPLKRCTAQVVCRPGASEAAQVWQTAQLNKQDNEASTIG